MFDRVLIANRGAIAVRIARTLRQMGIHSVGVYAESDRDSLHLSAVDEAFPLGDGGASDTYINEDKLFEIIERTGAEAVHPGYGFLSENAGFAERLAERGVVFIGPRPEHIRRFGLKHEARAIAERAGVDLMPGSGLLQSVKDALHEAERIGYPVMLKSTAGGGGIGMRRADGEADLEEMFGRIRRLAAANFGDDDLYLEKLIAAPRHVEVQAFGDGCGDVLIVGDRDCTLQRRHQKVIEECPAPNLTPAVREELCRQARALLASVEYRMAGTVEFLYDAEARRFYFLEVNTRLQVEHGVTECVYGVDLVEWMLRLAAGSFPPLSQLASRPSGHAVQARVYAEDPNHAFRPTPGDVSHAEFPSREGLRVDTWLRSGASVSSYFDPMLAKVICHGQTRQDALDALSAALRDSSICGIETNLDYLAHALEIPAFREARMTTASLDELDYVPASFDVLEGGAATTVQSWPGRQGYWNVGVPPSGPMDDLSFRLGNRLMGNAPDAAGLEMVVQGPQLKFNTATTCVIAGPACDADLDGEFLAPWAPFDVERGQTLHIGRIAGGVRAYLLVAGGIDVPVVMGSTATFALGGIGGFNGRALRAGDTIRIHSANAEAAALPAERRPGYGARTTVRVIMGPHTSPDFFTEDDMEVFLAARWTVHYNSSRTGVRLTGPQPAWARPDGGEAGLHPSNIHDTAYAFGSIDFTGDMPVILGPDGPSLGGFVCPAAVVNADRWKLGQLAPGDTVRFVPVTEAEAARLEEEHNAYIDNLDRFPAAPAVAVRQEPVIHSAGGSRGSSDFVIRRAGQEWLLVEFGPHVLDIALHLRAHAFAARLEAEAVPGIVESTLGIRSLQIRFDRTRWNAESLAAWLVPMLEETDRIDGMAPESRIVRLPMSWDDPACREAVQRYMRVVREDAPWCPDNIEFIRRINGLDDADAVKDIVFGASYLVMGLGDVYLGAPVATPLDPRHRLVTTKYNPARTWTAENSVGIGGSYLCIYGMEGPGGYQFVGRTLQVWNRHRIGSAFDEHWLLRPFDQIRFYEVDAETLLEMREAFPRGELELDIRSSRFDYGEYVRFLDANAGGINAFTETRKRAFDAELAGWRERGLLTFETTLADGAMEDGEAQVAPGATVVTSPMAGSIWSVRDSETVSRDDVLVVVEAMKSEFEIRAPVAGKVALSVSRGQLVAPGQRLAVIEPA
ncbi:MAG: urea carboxylase [Gammaproteobacteria bacterium]|nr:urea carboxylase [Gammaproteobacteria bacterium]